MDKEKEYPLPFVTRKMLNFEYATTFEIVLRYRSRSTQPIIITGATKEGVFTFEFKLTSTTSVITHRFPIPDMPIWISIIDKNSTIDDGSTYITSYLSINKNNVLNMTAGYISRHKGMSWPQTQRENSTLLEGELGVINGTDPAAGNETSVDCPTGFKLRVRAITFTLVTSATVANRRVHVKITNYGADVYEFISSIDQAAGTTRKYTLMPIGGAGTYGDDNDIIIPIPENITLKESDQIITSTTNLQVGDNFSSTVALIERYVDFLDGN